MKTAFIHLSILLAIACGTTKKAATTLPVKGNNTYVYNDNLPACVNEQLSRLQNNQYENPPLQVDEYEFNGKRMFLFKADCCDQYDILFDENCKGTCAPSGGITGKGDGKCGDFKEKAKLVKTIWKRS